MSLLSYLVAEVDKTWSESNVEIEGFDRFKDFNVITGVLMNVVFYGGLAIATAFGIINGVKYATSGGDKMQAQAAKTGITNAIIGFIIVIGFRTIVSILLKLLSSTATVPTVVTTW